MVTSIVEHVNITVEDPKASAETLCRIFDWHVRWQGDAILGGHTVHVGSESSYLALYTIGAKPTQGAETYTQRGGLNHIGVVVNDLDEVEKRVEAEGFEIHSHADYEPGKRFYFHDANGVEIEVITYQ